jgi:hypothetical protein
MKAKHQKNTRDGAALLVVLLIIMVITVLSLGFLSQSDVELACGENMILRTQMDYLAESGLEHARGLILNPQDISSEYWTGATGLQLIAGSNDYYDIEVIRDDSDPDDLCNYIIDCNSYRLRNGERAGFSGTRGILRLDPCIAFWSGANATFGPGSTVNGDVCCTGILTLIKDYTEGAEIKRVYGDVFAETLTGDITGQKYTISDLSLDWPNITIDYFIDKPNVSYHSGNFTLSENIEGMLLVDGNLTIQLAGSVNIIADKNLPALYVTGDLIINEVDLNIEGLAVIGGNVFVNGDTDIYILGGMFVQGVFSETAPNSSDSDYNGLLYNGPKWQPTGGQSGGAIEFDGVDDYIQTLDSTDKLQILNDYTLSVWTKLNAYQKDFAGIISKCTASGGTNHWTLQFNSGSSKKLVIYHPDYLPIPRSWDLGITLSEVAGAWHHIGIVRQGNIMTSYLDGAPRNTGTWNNAPGNGSGHLNIGVDRTALPGHVYKGLIDEVRIYDSALDTGAISRIYNGIPDPNNVPIGYWKLDESGGSSITVTADPLKTAIILQSEEGNAEKWSQAAGAFFRNIDRK